MSCPIKVNNNTIELTVQPSCSCVLDLLCVTRIGTPTLIKSQCANYNFPSLQRSTNQKLKMPLKNSKLTS